MLFYHQFFVRGAVVGADSDDIGSRGEDTDVDGGLVAGDGLMVDPQAADGPDVNFLKAETGADCHLAVGRVRGQEGKLREGCGADASGVCGVMGSGVLSGEEGDRGAPSRLCLVAFDTEADLIAGTGVEALEGIVGGIGNIDSSPLRLWNVARAVAEMYGGVVGEIVPGDGSSGA